MQNTHSGKCLCGSITIKAKEIKPQVGACHCSMCRKWGAGPFLGLDCGSEVTFSKPELVQSYQSSEWAERGFCKSCGTHLFYRLKQADQYIMPVDLFEALSGLEFDHQIFIDEKPEFYSFANKTHTMTGEEVFAQYAPPSE